jgi:propionate CoA-transferase
LVGASGFINISQSARKVVFTGLFASGAMEVAFRKGNLHILRDGKVTQFVEAIEHRTFSSAEAHRLGTTVLYITERCVFRSATDGLELIEIAPGVDLQRDILDKLSFAPILRCQPALMDERIFHEPTMDIRLDIQVL